jgi:sugar O-acyltransferase (sialic acid O-acetyltransferase NeuD family)
MPGLIIIGGGGHALVVAEAAVSLGMPVEGFLDDDPGAALVAGNPSFPRLGALSGAPDVPPPGWIIGLGDLSMRRAWISRWGVQGARTVMHRLSIPSPSAEIGAGVYIGPGAIVHTRAQLGAHSIINSGAIVEHECNVGENVHIAPGAVLGGRVRVGADSLVGIGSRVLPCLTIGRRCTIGAGAVVTRHVPDGAVFVGVPGKARY